jgi:hypothetical protein
LEKESFSINIAGGIKNMKKSTLAVAAVIALGGTFAGASEASAKPMLPVVAGAQSLTKAEKVDASGEGLINLNLNINLLNNLTLLNNILNIGSFNSYNRTGR